MVYLNARERVADYLAHECDRHGNYRAVPTSQIAEEAELHLNATCTHLGRLLKEGLVRRVQKFSGYGTCSTWQWTGKKKTEKTNGGKNRCQSTTTR